MSILYTNLDKEIQLFRAQVYFTLKGVGKGCEEVQITLRFKKIFW